MKGPFRTILLTALCLLCGATAARARYWAAYKEGATLVGSNLVLVGRYVVADTETYWRGAGKQYRNQAWALWFSLGGPSHKPTFSKALKLDLDRPGGTYLLDTAPGEPIAYAWVKWDPNDSLKGSYYLPLSLDRGSALANRTHVGVTSALAQSRSGRWLLVTGPTNAPWVLDLRSPDGGPVAPADMSSRLDRLPYKPETHIRQGRQLTEVWLHLTEDLKYLVEVVDERLTNSNAPPAVTSRIIAVSSNSVTERHRSGVILGVESVGGKLFVLSDPGDFNPETREHRLEDWDGGARHSIVVPMRYYRARPYWDHASRRILFDCNEKFIEEGAFTAAKHKYTLKIWNYEEDRTIDVDLTSEMPTACRALRKVMQ